MLLDNDPNVLCRPRLQSKVTGLTEAHRFKKKKEKKQIPQSQIPRELRIKRRALGPDKKIPFAEAEKGELRFT